jgi:hypothetical protein
MLVLEARTLPIERAKLKLQRSDHLDDSPTSTEAHWKLKAPHRRGYSRNPSTR